MLSLLRADFYKLVRKKSFYICNIIALVLSVLGVYSQYYKLKTTYFDRGISLEQLGGFKIFSMVPSYIISSGIFCTILISMFISDEFSFGTIRNMISSGKNRVSIYLSKLLMSFSIVVGMALVCAVSSTVAGICFFGIGEVTRDDYLNLFKTAGLIILAQIAVQSIYSMIAFIFQNKAVTLATNILIGTLINFVMTSIITIYALFFVNTKSNDIANMSIPKIFDKIYMCWPENNIRVFSMPNSPTEDIMFGIIVCVAAIIISTCLGMYIFNKKDVK